MSESRSLSGIGSLEARMVDRGITKCFLIDWSVPGLVDAALVARLAYSGESPGAIPSVVRGHVNVTYSAFLPVLRVYMTGGSRRRLPSSDDSCAEVDLLERLQPKPSARGRSELAERSRGCVVAGTCRADSHPDHITVSEFRLRQVGSTGGTRSCKRRTLCAEGVSVEDWGLVAESKRTLPAVERDSNTRRSSYRRKRESGS